MTHGSRRTSRRWNRHTVGNNTAAIRAAFLAGNPGLAGTHVAIWLPHLYTAGQSYVDIVNGYKAELVGDPVTVGTWGGTRPTIVSAGNSVLTCTASAFVTAYNGDDAACCLIVGQSEAVGAANASKTRACFCSNTARGPSITADASNRVRYMRSTAYVGTTGYKVVPDVPCYFSGQNTGTDGILRRNGVSIATGTIDAAAFTGNRFNMLGRYNGTTISEQFTGGLGVVIACRPTDITDWGALQRLLLSLGYGAGGFGDSSTTIAWIGGDTQDGDIYSQAEMLDMVIREQNLLAGTIASDAFALTGDYTSGATAAQYTANTALFAAIADATWLDTTKPPLIASLGDDDDDDASWVASRDAALTGQAAVRGAVQYFLHETENVSWIVLDATTALDTQAAWLTDTALPAVTKGIVIVLCHKLPYSLSTWPPDTSGLLQIIAALEGATNCDPVLICGHTHVYSRWHRMLLGVRDDANGRLYVNAGRTCAYDPYNPDLTRDDTITYGARTDHVLAADVGAASIDQTIFGIIRVQLVSGGYVLKHYNIDVNGTTTVDDTSPVIPIAA